MKIVLVLILFTFITIANFPVVAQAATRVEMIQQIELLTKIVSLLEQLKASQQVVNNVMINSGKSESQAISYIESVNGKISKDGKSMKATVMFGLGDLLIVDTPYDQNYRPYEINEFILNAVKKIRPTAQFAEGYSVNISI